MIDLALVAAAPMLEPAPLAIDAITIAEALHVTFDARMTHPVPRELPTPPLAWHARYPARS